MLKTLVATIREGENVEVGYINVNTSEDREYLVRELKNREHVPQLVLRKDGDISFEDFEKMVHEKNFVQLMKDIENNLIEDTFRADCQILWLGLGKLCIPKKVVGQMGMIGDYHFNIEVNALLSHDTKVNMYLTIKLVKDNQ